jgi:hypothetical protein
VKTATAAMGHAVATPSARSLNSRSP